MRQNQGFGRLFPGGRLGIGLAKMLVSAGCPLGPADRARRG